MVADTDLGASAQYHLGPLGVGQMFSLVQIPDGGGIGNLFRKNLDELGVNVVKLDETVEQRLERFSEVRIASLLGKYWYNEPMETPARAAILLVVARA
jgi:hypothetical protein